MTSIVIPVYNSATCLMELYKQIHQALSSYSYQIVLVNDHSIDTSWLEISQLALAHENVVGINLRKNSGQDNAIMAGLSHSSGEYVVIMDDDLQHQPSYIPSLMDNLANENSDVCYAVYQQKQQSLWKNIGSWFNGKIAEYVIEKPANIYLSPYKILKRSVVLEILKYKGCYPYIDGLIFSITKNISTISIQHHKRLNGQGNYNLIRSVKVFLKLVTGFSTKPLHLISIFGTLVAISGALLSVYYLLEYFLEGAHVEGWTTLIIINLIIGGLTLVSLGLIGEYLGRTFLTVNSKPSFTIKSLIQQKKVIIDD